MTVGVPLPHARGRRLRLPPAAWWRDTRAAVLHLLAGTLLWSVPLGPVLVLFSLVAMKGGPLAGTGMDKGSRAVIALSVLAVGFLVLYALAPRFTAMQRVRFEMILGVRLAPFPPYRPDRSGLR